MKGEKKILVTKWSLLIISLIGIILLILNNTICTDGYRYYCFLAKYDKLFMGPTFFILFGSFVVSVASFAVNKKIYIKWLIFFVAWLLVDIILIINYPVNSWSGYMGAGPETKEDISRWMSFFLIFVSLAMFLVSKMENTATWKKWVYGILIFIVEVFLVFALT